MPMARLYLVPTPIGNMDDITLRAVKVLSSVDVILAEDTRTSQVLLKHLGIEKKMWSHHKFNEHAAVEAVAQTIVGGQNVALISDAGTPGISDPGFLLVRTCIEHGIDVETLFGGDRPASVSRELTKKFEETVRGSLAELTRRFSEREPKGEIVLIVAGKPRRERTDDRSNHETE